MAFVNSSKMFAITMAIQEGGGRAKPRGVDEMAAASSATVSVGGEVFQALGAAIESRWRDQNYDEQAFPNIAAEQLAEAELNDRVTAWEAVRWVHSLPQLPIQHDVEGRFGNPPITLYSGRRFHIDIYFWVNGTTDIHQHGFHGAFQVLLGSSIHSRYGFQQEHAISERFLIGQVIFKDSELLKVGDIRKIIAGKEFIHSLFHLDRPSATITVRSHEAVTAQPQYSYLRPHVAYDPFFKQVSAVKILQSVSLLMTVDHADAEAMIGELLASLDFHTTFSVLQTVYFLGSNELEKAWGVTRAKERFHRLLEKARHRHGRLVDVIPPIVEEQKRVGDLVQRRSFITTKEHRFLLALLLNVPSRTKILELVSQYFPKQDPAETVLEWVEELSTTKVWGSSEPNVLGIKDFDNDHLFVLQKLLEGISLEQSCTGLRKQYRSKRTPSLERKLEAIAQSLRGSTVFKFLLAD